MSKQREKALKYVRDKFNEHKGHTITYNGGANSGQSFKLKQAVIVNDTVMLQAEGEPFATHYSDALFKCSCKDEKR